MKLADRVDKLENALLVHLEESGTIRTDLAWLKKAFWTLAVAIVTAQVAQFSQKWSVPQCLESAPGATSHAKQSRSTVRTRRKRVAYGASSYARRACLILIWRK
jgi:hypothetical protein